MGCGASVPANSWETPFLPLDGSDLDGKSEAELVEEVVRIRACGQAHYERISAYNSKMGHGPKGEKAIQKEQDKILKDTSKTFGPPDGSDLDGKSEAELIEEIKRIRANGVKLAQADRKKYSRVATLQPP